MVNIYQWGIIGPGRIARSFAEALKTLPEADAAAVCSRDIGRACAFAREYSVSKAYDSVEQLCADSDIDIVYIANPHAFHARDALICLNAGKSVLCEKPITVNAAELKELIDAAGKNGVFLMEALWTRFLPAVAKVREWLDEGKIGKVKMINTSFGFTRELEETERLLNPDLAGGALLDIGVYNISFTQMVMKGAAPERVFGEANIGATGVDEEYCACFRYPDGALASLTGGIQTGMRKEALIYGTKGMIHVPDFWKASSAVLEVYDEEKVTVECPYPSTGLQFQAREVMRRISEGKLESDIMPLSESLLSVETMDELRRQWGLVYPFERRSADS
jgi:predicted dehydrogenase